MYEKIKSIEDLKDIFKSDKKFIKNGIIDVGEPTSFKLMAIKDLANTEFSKHNVHSKLSEEDVVVKESTNVKSETSVLPTKSNLEVNSGIQESDLNPELLDNSETEVSTESPKNSIDDEIPRNSGNVVNMGGIENNDVKDELIKLRKSELEKLKEASFDEGFSSGKAVSESVTEDNLTDKILVLEKIIDKLNTGEFLDFTKLQNTLEESVLQLSSKLAGINIEECPEEFLLRIEKLVSDLRQVVGQKEIFLNEIDYKCIKDFIGNSAILNTSNFKVDCLLKRGNIRIVVGGVEISD